MTWTRPPRTPRPPGLLTRILGWSGWRIAVPLAITLIALIVPRDLSRDVDILDLKLDLAGYGWHRIGLSVGAMLIS